MASDAMLAMCYGMRAVTSLVPPSSRKDVAAQSAGISLPARAKKRASASDQSQLSGRHFFGVTMFGVVRGCRYRYYVAALRQACGYRSIWRCQFKRR